MNILVLTCSPNKDGLTAACASAAAAGIRSAGVDKEEIGLNDLAIARCRACNDGWGDCLLSHYCQELDDFQALHARFEHLDGLVLITPVYWGEMSESAKAFCDRLRRCEANRPIGESLMFAKPVIAVAAAGGSGNGMITCLLSMERWILHLQARLFDLIAVNRWSRDYKLAAIQAAGKAMADELSTKGNLRCS